MPVRADLALLLRRRLSLCALGAMALTTWCGPVAAQQVMQPGAWEFTTRISREPPGKPPVRMGEHTQMKCLSAEYLAGEPYFDPQKDATRPSRQVECSHSDYQREENAARWIRQCQLGDAGVLTAHVQNRASPHTLHLRSVQSISQAAGAPSTRIVMESEGRYVGPCGGSEDAPDSPAG